MKAVQLLPFQESEDEEENCYGNLDEESYEDVVNNINYEQIISIKCAAHTLQLAVKDFLPVYNPSIISEARTLVKTLRSPAFR